MLDIASISAIAAAFFVAAASPGPATLAVANVSMSAGRKAGLRFGLGLSVGLAFWGLIAATGLGALLQTSTYALVTLKLLGGMYLLWLAFNSARSAAQTTLSEAEFHEGQFSFRQGLFLNLSNPKAVFAWMAVLAIGLGESGETHQVILATGLCIALGFFIYAFYALMFSTSGAMAIYRSTRRWIEGAIAGLFALAGLSLIRSAMIKQ